MKRQLTVLAVAALFASCSDSDTDGARATSRQLLALGPRWSGEREPLGHGQTVFLRNPLGDDGSAKRCTASDCMRFQHTQDVTVETVDVE